MPNEKKSKKNARDKIHHDLSSVDFESLLDQEKLIMVETPTGEVIPLAEIIPEDRVKYLARQNNWAARRVSFYIGMQEREEELAIALSPHACKILMYLKAKMYLNNKIKISIFQIGKDLGMNKTTTYKAFVDLVNNKVVVNVYRRNDPTWFMDPAFCFKGSFRYQKHLLNKFVELVRKPVTPDEKV